MTISSKNNIKVVISRLVLDYIVNKKCVLKMLKKLERE